MQRAHHQTQFESEILSSSDKIKDLEREEIDKLLEETLNFRNDLQVTAAVIGDIDFYSSLAVSAVENKFSCPSFNDAGITSIKQGRHPVVEKYFTTEIFIPNDVKLDRAENIIKLAREHNVPIKEDPDLVALLVQLDLDQEIPPELYKVVAEILAFVYSLDRSRH